MPVVDSRSSIWPIIIAPLVGCVYYMAARSAFAQSIVSVLGSVATRDIDPSDIAAPHWGSHWVYRGVAEVISTGFGTFIAAGLAYGRERLAAMIGSTIISLQALARLAILAWAWKYVGFDESTTLEPWYQYAIDGAMIFAPPAIGSYVAEAAEDMHRETPRGFGGVNRFHFLWLWVAAYFYALGLITPIARIYKVVADGGTITLVIVAIINAIPAVSIAIPGYYGVTLLSGHHGGTMHPAGRNMVGALVLIFGFLVGAGIQYAWYWGVDKIFVAIFG